MILTDITEFNLYLWPYFSSTVSLRIIQVSFKRSICSLYMSDMIWYFKSSYARNRRRWNTVRSYSMYDMNSDKPFHYNQLASRCYIQNLNFKPGYDGPRNILLTSLWRHFPILMIKSLYFKKDLLMMGFFSKWLIWHARC